MSDTVDLRSDTVTRPTPAMRRAMLEAELGDDVFGDDPTVNRLQARAAEIFGFEDALFFPSGTQSHLAALMSHCQRAEAVLIRPEQRAGLAWVPSARPKGLGAPAGTVLLGKRDFIARARRARKILGGAMRQAGVIAAAGLYALENHTQRLAEDHANAERLADGLR